MKTLPAALSCVLMLAACAHAGGGGGGGGGAEREATPGQPFGLQPGQSARLPDRARLRFVEVSNDSRCRPGQQCIRAGEAVLAFELEQADGGRTALSLDTAQANRGEAGAWTVELQSLDFAEPPTATLRIASR